MLIHTGGFGEISEHLHPLNLSRARREMGILPEAPQLQVVKKMIEARRTEDGLFTTKVMWEALHPVLQAEAERQDCEDSKNFDLQPLFPNLRCAYLRREGRLRQAISLTKAKMQDHWHPDTVAGEVNPDPPFDPWQIENELRILEENDATWEAFFETHGITPLPLVFEEVIEDPQSAIQKLVAHCELPLPDTPPQKTEAPVKMGNSLNAQWETQYHAFKKAAEESVDASDEIATLSCTLQLPAPVKIRPATPTLVEIGITNTGDEPWPANRFLALESRWPERDDWAAARAYLLDPLDSGESVAQKILLFPPDEIGDYPIEFQLVRAGSGEATKSSDTFPILEATATVRPRVTAEDEAWVAELFPTAELHDDGWFWLEWFGYFRVDEAGAIFHEGLGWLLPRQGQKPEEGGEQGYDFWSKELDWFWTAPKSFPWINRFEKGGWVELDL